MDEELKKIARKQKSIPSQNCQSKIKNRKKTEKYYLPILPKEIATPEELKQLYKERWTVEKSTTAD